MLTHVVLMKFTERSDREHAKALLDALPATVPQLLSLKVELDAVGADGAYDLVLISTHEDEAGLQGYVTHPDHVEAVSWIRPRLSARAVVDF